MEFLKKIKDSGVKKLFIVIGGIMMYNVLKLREYGGIVVISVIA